MTELMLIEYLKKNGLEQEVNKAIKDMAIDHFTSGMEVVNLSDEHHFTESEAKEIVANMYHCHNGRKYIGEKYCMDKARLVKEYYSLSSTEDVYVAINAQFHDYAVLFKQWFGTDIDELIIQSAIIFWFKDEDYTDNKVYKYFH